MARRDLPRWMHLKHGRYYFVRENKWHPLSRDLHDALIEYARIISASEKGKIDSLIDRALADMKLTVAAKTYQNYASCARRVKEAFAEFEPSQVKPVHVARFLDDNKATPSMANLLRSFMKGAFDRAVRWGEADSNPVREIKNFKTAKRDRYITPDEYKSIRQHASPTLQSLMDVAYITGQRIGDVMAIRYADITDAGVFVKQQKTGNKVLISMTPDLAASIEQARALHQSVKGMTLFHRRNGKPLSYQTIYGHWRKACDAAKVDNAHFHDIRAATATDAKRAGQDSKTLLGHTTESSHNRYLRSKETPVAKPVRARKS